ncbi:MAG: hypothetical protein H7Y59_00060 [Anaerolineales bacterium]|nr:hypothetical protein [Anaerolineales bacterium]
MADVIKCPVCGESNLPDQEFCQYCQSRLQPLTGSLKGANDPIKPGQAPTKKNTAELEPILPQWLRDARDSARKSAEDNAAQAGSQPQESFNTSPPDLLAGLQSQSGSDEEETPDWLANITGAAPKAKKPQAESPEVRWVELGGAKDFPQEESAKEEPEEEPFTPSWLTGLTPTESSSDVKDELTDWFRQENDSQKSQQSSESQPAPFDTSFSASESSDTPDWLKKMAADNPQNDDALFSDASKVFETPSSDTPDWLRQMAAEDDNAPILSAGTFDAPTSTPSSSGDAQPDWLRAMADSQDRPQDALPTQSADSASFSELTFDEPPTGIASEAVKSATNDNVPDWMKGFQSTESEELVQSETPAWLKKEDEPAPSAETEAPAWLSSMPATESEPEQAPAQDDAAFGDIPSWLKAAAPQSSLYEESAAEDLPLPASDSSPDSPDWLNTFKSTEISFEGPPPAFTPDSQSNENIDALFAEMPDWLTNATDPSPSTSTSPIPAANTDENIAPGELPSWVQAMRPVDTGSARSSSSPSASGDRTLESRGALAGLQGVLPSVPGFTPTSKPKAYSIKLQASEEQQAHAGLLEQILAAETAPVPIASFSALTTSRNLRWFLSFALLAVITTVLFMRGQSFPMPVGVPREINGALQVSQSIPEGAPVLVAFDYEPARAGEMEATAAPIFNVLRQPNLTFISTNEMGSILAERFISGPLADPDQSGFQYLNLGYLPGGQMGIRAFAQNPTRTTPQLVDITSLSQFMALIIITDNADSARAWIEQTSSIGNAIPILIISSAQAAPMIQPYYESQQVGGLVSGLYGGAVFEQNNGGVPGITRTYWDAYSIGMLLAMALIVGGGLLNLALGLRDRAAMRESN